MTLAGYETMCSSELSADERFLLVEFFFGLVHHFLYAGGVDAAVGNEALQGETGDLTADGVEAGNDDGLWRIVYDQFGTGSGFDGADVTSFAADDLAFDLIVVEGEDGDGIFDRHLGAHSLNGVNDHFAGVLGGVLFGFL